MRPSRAGTALESRTPGCEKHQPLNTRNLAQTAESSHTHHVHKGTRRTQKGTRVSEILVERLGARLGVDEEIIRLKRREVSRYVSPILTYKWQIFIFYQALLLIRHSASPEIHGYKSTTLLYIPPHFLNYTNQYISTNSPYITKEALSTWINSLSNSAQGTVGSVIGSRESSNMTFAIVWQDMSYTINISIGNWGKITSRHER